ncbi:uncharacterized protein LOC111896624 [Lactuca sativa]|uniref:uncharacterized protein LOC111896624 n=1 Tax=Lactuca sativa TaxID=4236 RepID=UPI001C68C91B|nr:uncharacterized protein LOC111896624 [Lactuca sativa]
MSFRHQFSPPCDYDQRQLEWAYALKAKLDDQERYSSPMPLIGMYIAVASLFCILAMAADLLHGMKNRKLWFPCKYFTVNAASLTVIAVAIKLPMDLTNLMPGYVDQAAKLGSLGFMCTMMVNLLPSLASMDNKELVTNMMALGVLVLTLVGNVCIQINTGVLSYHESSDPYYFHLHYKEISPSFSRLEGNGLIATIYAGMLLMLLIIFACSSIAILKSKQILESKYHEAHEKAIKDHQELQQQGQLTVEKLKKHVSNYWIMARTGSPQFMTACSATTAASGVICAFSTILHIVIMVSNIRSLTDYKSDYKWSMSVIFIIQFIGVIVGTIAPLSRCFAVLSFKLSVKWIWNNIKVFKVESYWTQKLYDWKLSSTPFPYLQILVLNICIGFQKTVVVACKMIDLIPIFSVICVLYCFQFWKRLKAMFKASSVVLVQNPEQLQEGNENLSCYVLQLQEDIEFAERTLKGILKSVNLLIQKAEKQQPNNLMKLLAESRGFEGVGKFESHRVPPLVSEEYDSEKQHKFSTLHLLTPHVTYRIPPLPLP